MTTRPIQEAARRLARELGINPAIGGVWARRMGGRESILVEVSGAFLGAVPSVYDGYPVVKSGRLNPTVKGIQNDL